MDPDHSSFDLDILILVLDRFLFIIISYIFRGGFARSNVLARPLVLAADIKMRVLLLCESVIPHEYPQS